MTFSAILFPTSKSKYNLEFQFDISDNLYKNYKGGIPCERLYKMFCLYLKMYMMLCQELFIEMELEELQVNIIKIFNVKFKSVKYR